MTPHRRDRSGLTLAAGLCALLLLIAAGRMRADPVGPPPARPKQVAGPSGLLAGSLGAIGLGVLYARRHRRSVQAV